MRIRILYTIELPDEDVDLICRDIHKLLTGYEETRAAIRQWLVQRGTLRLERLRFDRDMRQGTKRCTS